jgi:ribosomal protein L11 methylase PrmA
MPKKARHLVSFIATPQPVVEKMLDLARVEKDDVVYDLGCGDGRVVIAAAKKYGAHAVGVDINPERIRESEENARLAGMAEQVIFRNEDLFEAGIAEATVVTLYLVESLNLKLRTKLWRELRAGSRVVSHNFDMGDWEPETQIVIEGRKLYLWRIPFHPPTLP